MSIEYAGRCPLCGASCKSEHGPQTAILKHVGIEHMTPNVIGYLLEAQRIMGDQWFRMGLTEAAVKKRRPIKRGEGQKVTRRISPLVGEGATDAPLSPPLEKEEA